MATNANLPAGFVITSINGKRCTRVPRSLTTIAGETPFATPEAVNTTPIAASPPETASPDVQALASTPTPTPDVEPAGEDTTLSTPPPAAATTAIAPVEAITPAAGSSTNEPFASASPASKGTTPTISSVTSIPIPQSEISATQTSTGGASGIYDNNGIPSSASSSKTSTSITTTTNSAHVAESSTAGGISSDPKSSVAPVIGGVIGGVVIFGMIILLLWFLRRRNRRLSMSTPLTTGIKEGFYEIDNGSVGPTKRSEKWRAILQYHSEKLRDGVAVVVNGFGGLGGSLKSKASGDASGAPGVSSNTGNSQYFDGPASQHSRTNSSVLSSHIGHVTVRDRIADWWERLREGTSYNARLRRRERQSMVPFAAARSMSQRQSTAHHNRPPSSSQIISEGGREGEVQADQRKVSLSPSLPRLGSLDADLSTLQDPFADPRPKTPENTDNLAWKPPNPSPGSNPFADPINYTNPNAPKQKAYISDIRRSRGLYPPITDPEPRSNSPPPPPTTNTDSSSPPTMKPHRPTYSLTPTSRYPSSIAPSRDSYRDTVNSTFSTSARKGKGRSDPFDLERPELWRPKIQQAFPVSNARDSTRDLYPEPLRASGWRAKQDGLGPLIGIQPRVVSVMNVSRKGRVVSETGTYASKYSSGVISEVEWGDPGTDFASDGSEVSVMGSETTGWDRSRDDGDGAVSPITTDSKPSSRAGVRKAA